VLPALPGSHGLFSLFQHALTLATQKQSVKLTPAVPVFLHDFHHLVDTIHAHPAHLCELVPTAPTFIGACDASGLGMGNLQAQPVIRGDLARQMLIGGNYSLIPGQDIPDALQDLSIPIIPS